MFGRIDRIFTGFLLPPILGGFFCACVGAVYQIMTGHFDFTWMRISEKLTTIFQIIPISIGFAFFAFILYGVQSLLYSLVMEFFVQRIASDRLVIIVSMFLGVFTVRFLGLGGISGLGISASISNILVGVGGCVGLIVGLYLRYHFKSELIN